MSAPFTNARALDKLIGHYIEPTLERPTFLLHHPVCMSPLARVRDDSSDASQERTRTVERFELFVGGKEVCNAYSELNDPDEQMDRFVAQERDRAAGDDECPDKDVDYCESLKYGLPPTAGWGMGIDRLVMLLTGAQHVREVLFFPIMKPLSVK
eukprot:TRINITY_DN63001_c0_g2_i2.p1 TRINITY_DN63001_c0_g2~~TRINITY_DN63001_c0_g2_i2.p1  ORF type:complete len:161 (+),score=73.00 TRINITY_DN63001_c0_g2_i2:22-483(+)